LTPRMRSSGGQPDAGESKDELDPVPWVPFAHALKELGQCWFGVPGLDAVSDFSREYQGAIE
jgi:hypothetical protein